MAASAGSELGATGALVGRQREAIDFERSVGTPGGYKLHTVVNLAERRIGANPTLCDDVLEDRKEIHRAGGDVSLPNERNVAAGFVHSVTLPIERERLHLRPGWSLRVVVRPDHDFRRAVARNTIQPNIVGEFVDPNVWRCVGKAGRNRAQ